MPLHNRQMHRIARGHLSMSHHHILGANDSRLVDYKHLIGNAKHDVERRLNSVPPIYGHITVQDFSQNLGIRHQALPVG